VLLVLEHSGCRLPGIEEYGLGCLNIFGQDQGRGSHYEVGDSCALRRQMSLQHQDDGGSDKGMSKCWSYSRENTAMRDK
jgi:hypothetical protein